MLERIAIAPQGADAASDAAIVERARQRGFRRFVALGARTGERRSDEEWWSRDGDKLRGGSGDPTVPIARAGNPEELRRLVDGVPDGGVLCLEWTGDRVIPLENAVAHRGRRLRLWTVARSAREAPAALGALEHGADRVIVEVRTPGEIEQLEHALGSPLPSGLDWTSVPVAEVRAAGVGDRVLVDTTSLLRPEEGLLVGSAAAFLFLVASEAVGSAFSRPRPFRVNAGAAHSYVLMADGTTRYLSELAAGDTVLGVDAAGGARGVRVGRLKIERRPMVMIRAEVDGSSRTVFLQEAETVRLQSEPNRVAVTALQLGTPVRGVRLAAGRHLGTAVEETVEER